MINSIYWTGVQTYHNYPFLMWRSKKGYGDIIIISEKPNLNYEVYKSLTNHLEEVLEHIIAGICFGGENVAKLDFYQWVYNEGLFKLSFNYNHEFTVSNLKWQFISDNLQTFEVLYAD